MSERQINILRELRYVSNEIGYHEARRLPIEVRRWWIDEMQREAEAKAGNVDDVRAGKRTVDAR